MITSFVGFRIFGRCLEDKKASKQLVKSP